MAKFATPKESAQLKDNYKKLLAMLDTANKGCEEKKSAVLANAELAAEEAVISFLKTLPIEQLNNGGAGFRLSLLKSNGMTTVADVYTATETKIKRIKGIAAHSAADIKAVAASFAADYRKNVKIRLSRDSKTKASSKLITALAAYIEASPYAPFCLKNIRLKEVDYMPL